MQNGRHYSTQPAANRGGARPVQEGKEVAAMSVIIDGDELEIELEFLLLEQREARDNTSDESQPSPVLPVTPLS